MRASEFITEGSGYKTDQDTIDLVKMAWDEGKKPVAIAADLGLPVTKVKSILWRYYQSRPGQRINLAFAITDDDKKDIASAFINHDNIAAIIRDYGISEKIVHDILKSELGIDRYNAEMAQRRSTPSISMPNKITPDMLVKIKVMYSAGKPLVDISNYFNNIVTPSGIAKKLLNQPDYAELRAKRRENTRKVKHSPVATTNIIRPGEIGTLRGKGPGSKHTHGMFPSSKWGMYKP